MRHLFASLVIASAVVGSLSAPGHADARDLWGDTGVILSGEKTAVLSRVTRLSPDTRLEPVVIAEARIVDQAAVDQAIVDQAIIDRATVDQTTVDQTTVDQALVEDLPYQTTPILQDRALTAPPVPNRGAPARADAETIINPDTENLQLLDEPAEDGPDVSGVAIIDGGLEFDPKAAALEAYEMASLGPTATLPPEPAQPNVPLPNYDSGAFSGVYGGVGQARGMRLEIDLSGQALTGWFVDSSGQVFSIEGELSAEDGRARAAVVSAETAVGFLDLRLTNLGMAALFVPLAEDLTPMVSAARDYEFLRALSSEAQTALDASRSAREANAESDGGDDDDNDNDDDGGAASPLRSSSPWDDDRFN